MNQRISVNNNKQLLLMYQCIADRIDNDVFVKDSNGVYVIANAFFINKIRALGLIGSEVETVEGLTNFDIFNYDIAEQFSKDDAQVVDSKELLIKEEKVGHSNNLVKLFVTRKEPIIDEHGDVIAIYGNSIEFAAIKGRISMFIYRHGKWNA